MYYPTLSKSDSKLQKILYFAELIYQKTPLYLRWIFSPLKIIYNQLYRIANKFKINVWVMSGTDPLKTTLNIIFAGGEKNKNYIAKLAYNGSHNEIYKGRIWVWNIISSRIIKKIY